MKENTSTTMSIQSLKRVGTDSFAELLLTNNVFVDKSMFIKEFLEESGDKVVLITRPRRWGQEPEYGHAEAFPLARSRRTGSPLTPRGVPEPQALCWRRGSDRTSDR